MSKHASPTVVGAFVVGAFTLLLAGVIVLGGGRYFHHRAHVIVYFDGSVEGLRVGAPVKFRGIELGTVKDLRINMTGAIQSPRHVRIPVLLEIDEERLTSQGLRRLDLDDRKQVEELVQLGLRAQLEFESIVTGVRFVALDIRPDTPALLTRDPKYPEIPSLRGAHEEIPEKVNQVFTRLADVDFARLTDSLRATIDDADKLISSPDLARAVARLDDITQSVDATAKDIARTARDLRPAVVELKTTVASANTLIAPNGQLSYQIESTLRELQAAARSLRRLSDQLGRDPGSILRGGKQ